MPRPTRDRIDVRAAIVDAAARLLQEAGADGVTTRRVAERAGVQAPAIYRIFGDKDGLLEAVAEHAMATFVAAKAETVRDAVHDDVDPVEDLRAGWRAYVDFGLANPALSVLLSDPARAANSPATQSGRRVLVTRVRRVAQAGRLRIEEREAVELIHAAGTGAVLSLLANPPEQRAGALADQLLEAVLHRIVTDLDAPAVSPAVTASVALRALAPELDVLTDAERQLLVEWLDRITANA